MVKGVKTKRKLHEDIVELFSTPVAIDSDDERSSVNYSDNRDGLTPKRQKLSIKIVSEEFKQRFVMLDLGNRRVIYGKPLSSKIFHICGTVKFFTQLGFELCLVDKPKDR